MVELPKAYNSLNIRVLNASECLCKFLEAILILDANINNLSPWHIQFVRFFLYAYFITQADKAFSKFVFTIFSYIITKCKNLLVFGVMPPTQKWYQENLLVNSNNVPIKSSFSYTLIFLKNTEYISKIVRTTYMHFTTPSLNDKKKLFLISSFW